MGGILYFAGQAALCSGVFMVKKSKDRQNAVVYGVYAVVLCMIIQAAEAGILNKIPVIEINAAAFGVLHILGGVFLWYFILSRKFRQDYFFDKSDVFALFILAAAVVAVSFRQYGTALDDFNFRSDCDAARHYIYARNAADDGELITLYFSSLHSGLLMDSLRPLVGRFDFYRIFIIFEMIVLFLNGAMFWALIRRYLTGKASIVIGIAGTVAYMLGYSWNSMVFGTSYLSTGILCMTMILFLMERYLMEDFISQKNTLLLLAVSCYALRHSYSLFVPAVLGGIAVLIILKYLKSKPVLTRKMCVAGAVMSAVFIIIGCIFLYLWLVKGLLADKLDVLSWWGNIYGSLYGDFIFAVPFCILWYAKSIKTKNIGVECIMLSVMLVYIAVLFLGNYFGRISAYYYYKTYYVLWSVVFMLVLKAVLSLKSERQFIFSYMLMWGLLFLVYISGAETKLRPEGNLNLLGHSNGRTASDYFGLYHYNIAYGNASGRTISEATKDLYMEAAKLSNRTNEFIPYIGEYKWHEWTYFALAGIEHRDVTAGKTYEEAVGELCKYRYILWVSWEEPTINVSEFLDGLPVEYENEAGKIYRVDF